MRTFFSIAAALLLTAVSLPAHADPFTSVVVYGDSLSDNGNVYKATGNLFPPFPYVNGRFSNGPVAVEQLASMLNVPLLDYAYGGATSGTGNVLNGTYGLSGLPGIATEVQLATLPSSVLSTALTVLWGGANDFDALTNPTPAQAVAAAQTAAKNISTLAGVLQGEGATSILVPDLPDLGKVPRYLASGQSVTASLYTETFNAALKGGLPPGTTLFDTEAVFNTVLADQSLFPQGVTPCITGLAFPSCKGYLFFDDLHPTTAADTILARGFAAAVTVAPTPEPSSFLLLGTGLVSAAGLLRRRALLKRGATQEQV